MTSGKDEKNLSRLDVVNFHVFPALQASQVDLVVKVFEVSNERNVLQLLVTFGCTGRKE